ncbi:MAG: hypothetical protein LBQ66_04960 [Planctomycetaceae bacterium]|nr:hypothetical protein [Planctomycetaceae bacterium]
MPVRVPLPLFSACSARRKRNRLAVGCPPYVAGAFHDPLGTRASLAPTIPALFPPLLTAAPTGRFGISTRFTPPQFSACSARRKRNRPAVGYPPYVLAMRFTILWDEGKPRPYNIDAFSVLVVRMVVCMVVCLLLFVLNHILEICDTIFSVG